MGKDELEILEARLCEAAFGDCRPVWASSNYVFLTQLMDHEGELLAIYKPRDGETPLWDFPRGTLYRREVAAYRVARLFGWDFVPPTVIRDGPQGRGSLQLFIRHDPRQHFFVQRENPSLWLQLQRICLFDAVANNADRKGGHCLLSDDGRIWAIDNGLCFHENEKLRSVIWDWAGEQIPRTLYQELAAGAVLLRSQVGAAGPVSELLSTREFGALIARTERLLEIGRFPVPGEARHYPWPLV